MTAMQELPMPGAPTLPDWGAWSILDNLTNELYRGQACMHLPPQCAQLPLDRRPQSLDQSRRGNPRRPPPRLLGRRQPLAIEHLVQPDLHRVHYILPGSFTT